MVIGEYTVIDVLFLMLPIFAMIAIGSLFVSRKWFPAEGLPVLNQFVMNACIPVLLFSAISKGQSMADFAWANALVFAAASLCSALCLWSVLRFALRCAKPESIILALGGATANSIFLGFPIATAIIPERATEVFSWIVFAEVAIIMPTLSTLALLAEGQTDGNKLSEALRALMVSPVMIGMVSGFAFLATGLSLPQWLDKVVTSIVAAAPFIALFVIGGSILQFQVSRSGPRVIAITIGKLVIHPLFVGLAFLAAFGLNATYTRDAILFASMPLFLSYVVFCGRHAVGEVGASAIVVSTFVGSVTVTAVLALLY